MMTLMTEYGDDVIFVAVIIEVDDNFIIAFVIDVNVIFIIAIAIVIVIDIDIEEPFISRRSFCRFFLPPGPESKM